MTMTESLKELGVTDQTLTEDEKAHLDREGYLVVRQVLPREQAQRMAARLDEIAAEEAENAGKDFHTEAGTTRLGTLVNKDPMFDVCFLHPKALAAVALVTEADFGLSSITSRTALPGEGQQGLHWDSHLRAANALWVLDDFTPENGPTRLVPGSHRINKSPHEVVDPMATHPDEVRLLEPAGTLVVINARTWHGGTRNNTEKPRHLISAFFTPRGKYQEIADRKLNGDAQARLSEAAKAILDMENGH